MNLIPRASILRRRPAAAASVLAALAAPVFAADVSFTSPGLPPSRMDEQGGLVEDWGRLTVTFRGEGLVPIETVRVQSCRLDEVIPAAQAQGKSGPLAWTLTAFRAPVWPGGMDVLTVRVEETAGREGAAMVALGLPDGLRVGARTVAQGGRTVLALPSAPDVAQEMREWGYDDDAVSLPGWAKPEVECDPAFRNIRAGMGGVPIRYRFTVERNATYSVVLGLCESHWSQSGQRPVVCEVEGAPTQEVDPLVRWGQHRPGALLFAAKDANGDGQLDVAVLPRIGAPDTNPILNVLWLFPSGPGLNLDQVIAGRLNSVAVRYVDVGGPGDQSRQGAGKVEYTLKLAPHGVKELTFLAACPGGTAPLPEKTTWTPATLRRAAADVWRDWTEPRQAP